jgi:CubicO group peptidase (beta-lactamase class C family)
VKSRGSPEPVGAATVFEAASISKPVFAYVVASLARDGAFGLDDPLHALVSEVPEVAYDPRSRHLTPRILLTHQGGLPNWRSRMSFAARTYEELFPPADTLRVLADPGEAYRYSGEGYVLLQRVVEAATGRGLDDLARERVFGPLGMSRSSFRFDGEMRRDHARGHDDQGRPDKWEIALPLASSTLHTTAGDLARFGVQLASEIRGLGPSATLASPAVTVETRGDVRHAWGLGLGIVSEPGRRYVYHGGNNVIFIGDFLYGEGENLGYVLLTNSARGRHVVAAVEARVFGRRVRP